jgi:hypothetical protein
MAMRLLVTCQPAITWLLLHCFVLHCLPHCELKKKYDLFPPPPTWLSNNEHGPNEYEVQRKRRRNVYAPVLAEQKLQGMWRSKLYLLRWPLHPWIRPSVLLKFESFSQEGSIASGLILFFLSVRGSDEKERWCCSHNEAQAQNSQDRQ